MKTLPEEVEVYRDRMWRREPESRVESAAEAEGFVESVGFCFAMTDARRPRPSLYVAACGRRGALRRRAFDEGAARGGAARGGARVPGRSGDDVARRACEGGRPFAPRSRQG